MRYHQQLFQKAVLTRNIPIRVMLEDCLDDHQPSTITPEGGIESLDEVPPNPFRKAVLTRNVPSSCHKGVSFNYQPATVVPECCLKSFRKISPKALSEAAIIVSSSQPSNLFKKGPPAWGLFYRKDMYHCLTRILQLFTHSMNLLQVHCSKISYIFLLHVS